MPQLFFKKQFHAPIRDGTKRTTIRRWSRALTKAGQSAYAPGIGWLLIEAVEQVDLNHLGDDDARADGFDNRAALLQTLEQLYPDHLTDGKMWFRVAFTMKQPPVAPVRAPAG